MNNLFNRDEAIRITRETIEHALSFFHTVNRTVLGNQPTDEQNRHTEEFNRRIQELNSLREQFETRHNDYINRIENVWRTFFTNVTPTTTNPTQVINNMFDPNEFVRLNREVVNGTLDFVSKTHENVLRTFVPNPTTPVTQMVETINQTRDEFVRRNQEITTRINDMLHQVMPTLNRQHETTTNRTNTNTNRFDHLEITRINTELVENTTRFCLDLNNRLLHVVDEHGRLTIDREHLGTIDRTINEFINHHRTAITQLETLCRQTVDTHNIPTHEQHQVQYNELTRINHEIITHTVRFFMTLNEQIVRVTTTSNERMPNVVREISETIHRSFEEYRRAHHVLISRVDTLVREVVNPTTGTTTHHEPRHATETVNTNEHTTHTTEPKTTRGTQKTRTTGETSETKTTSRSRTTKEKKSK